MWYDPGMEKNRGRGGKHTEVVVSGYWVPIEMMQFTPGEVAEVCGIWKTHPIIRLDSDIATPDRSPERQRTREN